MIFLINAYRTIPASYGSRHTSYAAHTINQNAHILTAQKKKTRATQKSLPIGKWRSGKKKSEKDRKEHRTRQKNERGDVEMWDQTESSEIPERAETS